MLVLGVLHVRASSTATVDVGVIGALAPNEFSPITRTVAAGSGVVRYRARPRLAPGRHRLLLAASTNALSGTEVLVTSARLTVMPAG